VASGNIPSPLGAFDGVETPRIQMTLTTGIPEERCRRVDLGHAGHQGHPNAQRFDAVVTRAKPRRELEERENGETPRTRGAGPTFRKQS
jgi:hypothetical protein